ncbi:MAG: glutamine--tRNA ligase/YqeY domain fusion protein [Clostridia bacterium]|nr:glutamine--tRNA ligase/YqeY domain fusion protein [Clostridia bacterium]
MEELVKSKNFIEEFIEEDMQRVPRCKTRFPPEPNGYLHIGHAKALAIDFGMAEKYGGSCNLRFDDTNPTKEDVEFVDAIKYDIEWLGFKWDKLLFGSSYFDTCYELAEKLILKGMAYVDDLSKDEMREYRGTLTEPGKNSPWRDRSVEENLDLFRRMRAGEFEDGARTLRAKIDMASPNINMRDPAIYRIKHCRHHQTGDKWCIYPMYDFAHPIQDALEGVTHSLCSLEYEAHRPLYNWVVDACEFENKPRQIEFARLNMTNTMMSKRYLRALVEGKYVSGWDDPRMPTLCGMRRRGYSAAAIRDFLERIGVAKADSVVETAMLEHCVREDLNARAHRYMAVTDPLLVEVDNWEEGKTETITLENLPGDPAAGTHEVTFEKYIYIDREDFSAEPPKKYFRLKPEGEVRLKGAYVVKCASWETDETGKVVKVHVTYDPETKGGECERKIKGTIQFVPRSTAVAATFRLYEDLLDPTADPELDFTERLNPNSLVELNGFVEPALNTRANGEVFQLMRIGYFAKDADSTPEHPVFNRAVGLKDSFKA